MNRLVLVTGAAGGLGEATVYKFWIEGWSVVLLDRDSKGMHRVMTNISSGGVNGYTQRIDQNAYKLECDLADVVGIDKIMNQRIPWEHWSCLVNNAGVSLGGDAYTARIKDWEMMMNVNLRAPWLLSKYFVNNVRKHSISGAIVNISSMVGIVGAKKPGYAASKAGLIGLTKAFALQCGPLVRVNAVYPGAVDTPLIADWDSEKRKKISSNIPMGHIAKPSEIAKIVYFLADSTQSGYLTGAIVNATGGQYLGQ